MPRKAKTDPDVEKRVTRRSLQQSAPETAVPAEEPKPRATRTKASTKAAKASPSPARGGPAKGKGGGRRRAKGGSRKAAKKDESSDEGEEEYMNEDESGGGDQPTEKVSASPKKAEKDEEVAGDKTEEQPPATGRRTRGSPRVAPPKTPPSRRSGRGAAKIAAEKIGEQAAGEVPAPEEEEGEVSSPSRRGKKRKSVDADYGSPLKKQKTVEGEEPATKAEGKSKEEGMETEEPAEEKPTAKESGAKPAAGAKEDVEMKPAEPTDVNIEPAQPQEEAVGKSAEPQEDAKMEAAAPEEDAKLRPAETIAEPTPPVGEAANPSAEEAASKDMLKDFVVINKDEVPASDSPAIAAVLPIHSTPPKVTQEASPQKTNIEAPRLVPAVVVTAPEASAPAMPVLTAPVQAPVVQAPVAPAPQKPETVAPTNMSSNGDASNTSQQVAAPIADAPVNSNHTAMGSAPVVNNLSAPQLNDDLFVREFVSNKSLGGVVDATKQFSIVSYNVLAECHALRCAKEGSYSWLSVDNLLTEARNKRLQQELKYLDADIVCLQEVGKDYFNGTLQPVFQTLGYEGVFTKRNDLTTDEGEATFFRSSQFKLVHSRGIVLSQLAFSELEKSSLDDAVKKSVRVAIESPAVAMFTQLQSKTTGNVLSVANIHVTWDRFQRPDLQCVQAACAIKELVSLAGGADKPHVICGDFNSMPTSPVYQLTREGYLNDLSMAKLQALPTVQMADGKIMALVNLWWHIFQHTSSNMRSAYDAVLGCEPMTSMSPNDGVSRSLDYLWYASNSLNVVGVLRTPAESLFQKGIPNSTFPSDHVSIKAVLAFK